MTSLKRKLLMLAHSSFCDGDDDMLDADGDEELDKDDEDDKDDKDDKDGIDDNEEFDDEELNKVSWQGDPNYVSLPLCTSTPLGETWLAWGELNFTFFLLKTHTYLQNLTYLLFSVK